MIFFNHSIMHFMFSDLTFGIFDKLQGFSKVMEFLWNFWVGLCEKDFQSSCIASHMHYNTTSCILDACLRCWNDYVLVGLDWVEPIMFLLLYITCSCVFINTYLQFFIFWYTNCVGAFLLVSLSPSLLLLVSCVMAPKWKSILSQNPLCSGISTSSSNPIPSSIRFYDEKARKDFSENISRRGIYSKGIKSLLVPTFLGDFHFSP